mmetsp:Transcript_38062/g.123155  ORF Transcript_38062/g.123155 Transcript_38062/m.123155 type:complete len:712 (+) Transcript_38062:677-2812(+)
MRALRPRVLDAVLRARAAAVVVGEEQRLRTPVHLDGVLPAALKVLAHALEEALLVRRLAAAAAAARPLRLVHGQRLAGEARVAVTELALKLLADECLVLDRVVPHLRRHRPAELLDQVVCKLLEERHSHRLVRVVLAAAAAAAAACGPPPDDSIDSQIVDDTRGTARAGRLWRREGAAARGARVPLAERFGCAGVPVRCCAQASALVPLVPLHLLHERAGGVRGRNRARARRKSGLRCGSAAGAWPCAAAGPRPGPLLAAGAHVAVRRRAAPRLPPELERRRGVHRMGLLRGHVGNAGVVVSRRLDAVGELAHRPRRRYGHRRSLVHLVQQQRQQVGARVAVELVGERVLGGADVAEEGCVVEAREMGFEALQCGGGGVETHGKGGPVEEPRPRGQHVRREDDGDALVVDRLCQPGSPLRETAAHRAEFGREHAVDVLGRRHLLSHVNLAVAPVHPHQLHAHVVVPARVKHEQRAAGGRRGGAGRQRPERRREWRARKVNVRRRNIDVLGVVEASELRPPTTPEEPSALPPLSRSDVIWRRQRRLSVWSDDVVVEEADVLVLAVEAARAARVGEDEEVARAVGRAPRGAPLPQPLQALLLHQGRPAGVAARKEHYERSTGGSPVGRDKGALLDHAREEARCCVFSRPVLHAGQAPLPRARPRAPPVGAGRAASVVDKDAERACRAVVEAAERLKRAGMTDVLQDVEQRRHR